MFDSQIRLIWLRILACLAVVVLSCGLKNFLIVMVSGTALCPYLCSSLFEVSLLYSFPLFEQLFGVQTWVLEKLQEIINLVVVDKWNLATSLIFAPVFEELMYRGPLFIIRKLAHSALWWITGTGLTFVFALSHGRNGLALLPLIILGICSLWLITITRRFWPSITLHFLHNFFFSSTLVYQSLWVSD